MKVLGAMLAGLVVLGASFSGSAVSVAQTPQPLSADASDTRPAVHSPSYLGGTSTSPKGQTIGVNSAYLTMDAQPWLPRTGEFHYSRYPETDWKDEILKMKSALKLIPEYQFMVRAKKKHRD